MNRIQPFESIFAEADKLEPWTTFAREECLAYYKLASTLPPGSICLEIGLWRGRSTRIVAPVARDLGLVYIGVDPFIAGKDWTSDGAADVRAEWREWMSENSCPFVLHERRSDDPKLLELLPSGISLALIDGDHSGPALKNDMDLVLPRIAPGGHVCFHDYGNWGAPDVKVILDEGAPEGWEKVGVEWTMMIWRRVGA